MKKSPIQNPVLTIDLKIRFQSRDYQISLSHAARWIVPLVIVVVRIVAHFREGAP